MPRAGPDSVNYLYRPFGLICLLYHILGPHLSWYLDKFYLLCCKMWPYFWKRGDLFLQAPTVFKITCMNIHTLLTLFHLEHPYYWLLGKIAVYLTSATLYCIWLRREHNLALEDSFSTRRESPVKNTREYSWKRTPFLPLLSD